MNDTEHTDDAARCPCIFWARTTSEPFDVSNHHPKCDGTGKWKESPLAAQPRDADLEASMDKLIEAVRGEMRSLDCNNYAIMRVIAVINEQFVAGYQSRTVETVDSVTIWWERNDGTRNIEIPKRDVTGAEIMSLAKERGWLQPWQKILVEMLPNGTNKIIGQADTITPHQFRRFSAIANDDND